VRWRRDQADAGRRVAGLGDRRIHPVAGQLAALAGLGPLRELYLYHVGGDEVFRRHAEAARRDLLDRRTLRVRPAARQRQVAVRLLTALAGVRLAADLVHRAGERGVGFPGDRAEGHGAGGKAPDDVGSRHHLVEWDRLAAGLLGELDPEQAADRLGARRLAVDLGGKLLEGFRRTLAHGVLQRGDGIRRPHMRLAAHTKEIFAADL